MKLEIEKARSLWPATVHDRWMDDTHEPGLVSVIVPVRNRANLIIETLDSVAAQAWRPIELLVTDDGSTDGTPDAIGQWAQRQSDDIRLTTRLLRQMNRGAPAARNRGLIESRGEFIQYLDSDDVLHPDKLARHVAALRHNVALDFVWSESALFEDVPDFSAAPYCGYSRDTLLGNQMDGPLWHTMGGLYRRSACILIGPWDETLRRDQDWEYAIRFCAFQPNVRYVPGTLSLARKAHGTRINDLSREAAGIRWGLLATDRALAVVRGAKGNNRAIESGLARRYFRFAKNALQWDDAVLWREALEKALGCRTDFALRLNLLAVRWMRRLAGKRFMKRVFARKYPGFQP